MVKNKITILAWFLVALEHPITGNTTTVVYNFDDDTARITNIFSYLVTKAFETRSDETKREESGSVVLNGGGATPVGSVLSFRESVGLKAAFIEGGG